MNRRRMSGHRARAAAPPGFSIRAPWSVYEKSDKTSSTGSGPSLSVGASNWVNANVGQGLQFGSAIASSPVANGPGISLSADFSIGFFHEINQDVLDFGLSSGSSPIITLDDGTKRYRFGFTTAGSDVTLEVTHTNTTQSASSFLGAMVPLAYNHFGFSYSAGDNLFTFFLNGVDILGFGEPTLSHTSGGARIAWANNQSTSGINSQLVVAAVAYTAAEWAYIYNSGAGRLYSAWSIAS